jgi:uncharacterized membrane protein
MILSDTGESRVRGYLYVLERALRASVSAPLADDAVREVESHIRERVSESTATPTERDALETILTRLGTPSTVARAYSLELMMEEAATSGRIVAVLRSVFHAGALGIGAFFTALLLFIGYTLGLAFIAVAVLKPIFPGNVGLWLNDGVQLGAQFPAPEGMTPLGGYWIIPMCMVLGLAVLIFTHLSARRWITRLRERMKQTFARHRTGAR